MIQTFIIKPSNILTNYVRAFEIREFDTMGHEILKPIHAFHESLISIFICGQFDSFKAISNERKIQTFSKTKQPFCGVMGVQSYMKGVLIFKGLIKILNIQFKPTGFSTIFRMPAAVIQDRMYNIEDVFNNRFKELQEQLYNSENIKEMIAFVEAFLLKNLLSKKLPCHNEGIIKATEFILNQPGVFSIEQLAHHTNMSLKTFERKFVEHVGLTPKLFEKIRRFNRALDMKVERPHLNWTSICHNTGYYDQMHFIKDFTKFTGESPSAFFRLTPPPIHEVCDIL